MSAFSGIRILDFTQGIAGPMATMLLADFQAEVIKIEPPAGDRVKDHPGYLTWNRNKKRLKLDLGKFEGLHAARELIATADAVVFDNRPGELERLGLDSTTLCADFPRLLHVWMPPYGEHGRWSQLPQDDMLLGAVSSVAFMQMSYEQVPVYLITPQISYGHAVSTANAIAAGLHERRRSGFGQGVVVSGLHGVASVQTGAAIRLDGVTMRMSAGSSRGATPNYRLYKCSDGLWFFLGTLTQPFFLKALEAIGLIDLMMLEGIDGDYANVMNPLTNARVCAALDEKFLEKSRLEWLNILKSAGVPCGPAGERNHWFHDEPVAANDMRIVLPHPKLGDVEMPGVPAKLSDTPGSIRHHTLEVTLAELLSDGESGQPDRVFALNDAPLSREVGRGAGGEGGPLAGVKILDLGAFIAGTYAPGFLANYGAEVVKVEPHDGDPFRFYGIGAMGFNHGKRSLAIDLKTAAGKEVFFEMVRQSDVVLDNFRTGVRERLGIEYAALAKVNPRIISCSVTGYGPKGELSADPGFDPLMQARSGIMTAQGGNDEPVFYSIPVNDTGTAMMAAFGIQAALAARERTGRGQEVLTCLVNSSVLHQSGELTWYEGRPPAPVGGRDFLGPTAVRRHYPCADGWIALACTEPGHFHQVGAALGHPEWAGRMTAEQAMAEPSNGTLADLIAAALLELPRSEVVDRLLSRGVPAAPAYTINELSDDPWAHANGFFRHYEHADFGTIRGVRRFAEWSRSASDYVRQCPEIGQHSTEVLADYGISEERIATLLAGNVIKQG
jgi:crotonobetainyl-CoA:carnitine CoA-transferase CaiB-like acyl-CoA transferase